MSQPNRVDPQRRVLIVSNLFPPHVLGGAEVVAHRHAKMLAALGHQVVVFAGGIPKEANERDTLDVEQVDGLTVYRVPLRSLDVSDSFFWPAAAGRLRAVMTAEAPDLVHFHNIVGLGVNLLVEAAHSVPVAVTLHDPWGFCFKQTLLRNDGSICADTDGCAECRPAIQPEGEVSLPIRLRRDYVAWALDQADMLIAPSHYLAHAYREAGFNPGRIVVQSNGIDLGMFGGPARRPASPVSFLAIAYLGEHKGVPDLLDAAALLAAQHEFRGRWQLDIAGEGPLASEIESQIALGRFGGAVRLLGRIPRADVLRRLNHTHAVVLPARWPENEPVSLLEAMGSGCAQIATDVGGNPELVVDGASGWLVPRCHPAALADAMARYIADPTLTERHGSYNLSRRERFDESAAVTRIDRLHDRLVTEPRATAMRHSLVICGGGWPNLQTTAICSALHWAEGGERIRLIWHGWASPAAWAEASLVWNWSGDGDPPLLRRAGRMAIPVLAPAGSPAAALAAGSGRVRLYASADEAVRELLAARLARADQAATNERADMLADLFAATSPADSFNVPFPRTD